MMEARRWQILQTRRKHEHDLRRRRLHHIRHKTVWAKGALPLARAPLPMEFEAPTKAQRKGGVVKRFFHRMIGGA